MNFIAIDKEKNMSNGMRLFGNRPLTNDEIKTVKQAINEIKADESIFIFNDPNHYIKTCYEFINDVIYIGVDVFPDLKYGSTHPRDIMSIRAVLAHEYYGHRPNKEEYRSDAEIGENYHTTPIWQDECRASINAAKTAPGLTERDREHLISDAIKRAEEFGQYIQTDDFMKEVLYGYKSTEKNFIPEITPIIYVSKENVDRELTEQRNNNKMPKMQRKIKNKKCGLVR